MKDTIIYLSICTVFLGGFFVYGWYFYEPIQPPKCEEGWNIIRRFGFDIFLGNIPIEEARKQAGGNVIEWTKNFTKHCI